MQQLTQMFRTCHYLFNLLLLNIIVDLCYVTEYYLFVLIESCETSFIMVRSTFINVALVLTGVTVLVLMFTAFIIGICKKGSYWK